MPATRFDPHLAVHAADNAVMLLAFAGLVLAWLTMSLAIRAWLRRPG